jgi:hypothetical protein
MSRADAPNSSQPQPTAPPEPSVSVPSSVPKLVAAASPPRSVLPPTAPTPPASTANNNAQRTSERPLAAPYADAGRTGAGDSVFAGAALIKGRDRSGVDVEVLSGSAQLGVQTEVQLGFQRVAGGGGILSGSVETFSLRANVGKYNDDGSTGFNLGASATAVGFEGTVGGASSLTYGVSAGASMGGSIGTRDSDGDGRTEVCGRVAIGPATLGLCLENPL